MLLRTNWKLPSHLPPAPSRGTVRAVTPCVRSCCPEGQAEWVPSAAQELPDLQAAPPPHRAFKHSVRSPLPRRGQLGPRPSYSQRPTARPDGLFPHGCAGPRSVHPPITHPGAPHGEGHPSLPTGMGDARAKTGSNSVPALGTLECTREGEPRTPMSTTLSPEQRTTPAPSSLQAAESPWPGKGETTQPKGTREKPEQSPWHTPPQRAPAPQGLSPAPTQCSPLTRPPHTPGQDFHRLQDLPSLPPKLRQRRKGEGRPGGEGRCVGRGARTCP